MTGWDILDGIIKAFPPVASTMVLLTAAVVFIVGFSRHGMGFIKYGFKQTLGISELLSKLATKDDIAALDAKIRDEVGSLRGDMDSLRSEVGTLRGDMDSLRGEVGTLRGNMDSLRGEVGGLRTELETIKVNHFGHLKNFLTELTSILVDKGIINNENKARLDNQLRGM